ncbi:MULTISPECIES: phage tail protein [Halomonas]|uniref:phage tail-collar fiber domain-containing protein n=1 Tax=Halomonas TaxID=2745 RepID=UPI001C9399D8|nr:MULTISPECIES: phage tail protein [Halomonas]MBY6206891.1 phage tail protein [Halomonas sp. DP3Y7-2]MBY6230365.1 phage tail protein [Halomonas sp. DP3Y7-1]MCA0918526.1 phage tail protein [Halomonas denitrificans]
MPQFYTILTDVGQAKIANALALGQTIDITELAVGDGGGSLPTPDSSATALVNEVRRAPINTSHVDSANPTWIVVEQVLPPDVGGWTIREIGIYDVDGDLIGIGNYPETYKPILSEGSSRTQTVRFVMEVSDTSTVTLKVDPSVVLATRQYVEQQRLAHEQSRNHPAGTEDALGMLEIADEAEALAGADNERAMTPKMVHGVVSETLTGAVHAFPMTTPPPGFLKANGAAVSRAAYAKLFSRIGTVFGAGDGSTTFNLPDLRGQFLRGWDDGRGKDSGRALGADQEDAFMRHDHYLPTSTGGRVDPNGPGSWAIEDYTASHDGGWKKFAGINNAPYTGFTVQTFDYGTKGSSDSGETRPTNVALLFCIKY